MTCPAWVVSVGTLPFMAASGAHGSGARRSIRIDASQEPCKSRSGALQAVGLGTSLVADTGLKGVQQKCLCPSMPVERGSVIPRQPSATTGQDL